MNDSRTNANNQSEEDKQKAEELAKMCAMLNKYSHNEHAINLFNDLWDDAMGMVSAIEFHAMVNSYMIF